MLKEGDSLFKRKVFASFRAFRKMGISDEIAKKLVRSGFFPDEREPGKVIDIYNTDSSSGVGPASLKKVLDGESLIPDVRTVHVASLDEAKEYLTTYKQKLNPEMEYAFRGVNKEWFLDESMDRFYHNPLSRKADGKEISMLPGYWRLYRDNSEVEKTEKVFISLPGQRELVYYGLDMNLPMKNLERLGVHSISDLEDDDDPESREYYRRWKAKLSADGEVGLLAQHYGFPTRCLDITFDLSAAFFFALYKFTRIDNGKATYELNKNEDCAVYCMITMHSFSEVDIYSNSQLFAHAIPLRPIKQSCTAYYFGQWEKNSATNKIVLRFKPTVDFDMKGIPNPMDLFPDRTEDKFYDLLLKAKEGEYGDYFEDAIEYVF